MIFSLCSRTHFKLNHLVPMIILANLILALTSGILMNEFGHDSQGLHAHDITFGLIPQKLVEQATVVPPQLWSGLFFGLIALSELNTMAILTDACVSIIEDSFEIASKSRVLTSSIYCLASFSLGLPFLTSHGVELLERTTSALEASSLILVALGVSRLQLIVEKCVHLYINMSFGITTVSLVSISSQTRGPRPPKLAAAPGAVGINCFNNNSTTMPVFIMVFFLFLRDRF
jgi:SNF family Na+-dependent transporter